MDWLYISRGRREALICTMQGQARSENVLYFEQVDDFSLVWKIASCNPSFNLICSMPMSWLNIDLLLYTIYPMDTSFERDHHSWININDIKVCTRKTKIQYTDRISWSRKIKNNNHKKTLRRPPHQVLYMTLSNQFQLGGIVRYVGPALVEVGMVFVDFGFDLLD